MCASIYPMRNLTADDSAYKVIAEAEAHLDAIEVFRANERGSSRPGDPERIVRINQMLDQMMVWMSPIRSVIARSQWNDHVLTPQQRDRLDEISRGFQLNRRQLKKMRGPLY